MSVSRRRPPSSAVRPTTSAAGRPTTAAGFSQSFPPQYFGNTHYELDYEEEYEDESEDEDVFAFLPPTTADQEAATAAAAAAASAAAAPTQPVAGSSTDALLKGGQSPYAVGGAGTVPAALGYHPSPASTSSSSPFSHSPFATTTTTRDPPQRTSSLSPSSVPLDSAAPHPIPTYPDPTFDPWSRPAGAIPSSSAVSPYSHVQLASNNPYSPTNPYASTSNAYSRRPPTAHPLSPPSPSTDSHPSTGVSGMTTGQELFKLKRLTSAGGARVEEDFEPEEQIGVEEREREDGQGVIRDREAKEVRVNLPVLTGAKPAQDGDEGGARVVARARRKSSAVDDDDDAKSPVGAEDDNDDDDGDESAEVDEETTTSPDGTKSKRSRKRRQRSKKTKSKISTSTDGRGSEDVVGATTTGVNPHVGFVSPNAPLTAAAPLSGGVGVPDTPGAAERGLNSAHGYGQRMKNPNAQPYYAYAAMANAYGRGTSRATTAQTRGTSRGPGTATTATAAGTLSVNRPSYSQSHNRHPGDETCVSDDASFVARAKRGGGDVEDGDSFSMSGVSGVSGYYPDEIGRGGGWDDREGSIKMEFDFDAIEEEDSPFPEVRASVSNIDDPDMPAMTIRMWFVGLLLCMTSSALNVFFNFRSPAPTIVPLVLLLVSYPFGKFLAFTLPITTYRIPLPYLPRFFLPVHQPSFAPFRLIVNLLLTLTYPRALEFSLNPGPWNIKEHVLVYIMANVAVGNPYALNAIVVSEVFYELVMGYWFSLTFVLATQLTGFGLAGLCRRFLVWPASMVWPQNLVACTLLNTLHAEDEDDGIGMYGGGGERGAKGMSRYRFFVITTVASFVFFFLPGYLFEALSVFSFICWAAPNNVPVNQLFGVRTGLGMSVLTFDWTQVTWIGSPLMVPWWAEVHIFFGFVLFYWIMTPILYYTNSWKLAHFPISANEPYDRFGDVYDVKRVLQKNDTFSQSAYLAYSPLYLPATYAVTYLIAFALSTCVIVHTLLYHGRTLLNGFKKIRVEADDIHAKLMRNYPEVPDWWYFLAFCLFFSLAIVAVEVWNTDVPVWALLLSIILPIVYILPSGFIFAMTGQGISLNILAQIIPGTLLPGKPLANMVFKAYSVQTLAASTGFVQDLKLGHYVKVPPRATFMVQMIATILAAFVQVGVKEWIFKNVEGICQKDQASQLTCPHNQVFFTASAVWGLIGPTRQFGTGSIYHPHLYAIVVGAFLPIPFWYWQRRYPKSWVRYVSTPVILNGVSAIPPAVGINYSSWFAVGAVFQYVIRKRNFAWWSKFNYVLSSALDSGTVIAVMFIFFALQFPRGGSIKVNWWGNTVYQQTADYNREAYLPVPPGGVVWKGFTPIPTTSGVPVATAT